MKLPKHLATLLVGGILVCGAAVEASPASAGNVWGPVSGACDIVIFVDPATGTTYEQAGCPITVVPAPVPPEVVPPQISGGSNAARTMSAKSGK
ncbi:MAG: hypothetical protein ACM3O6_15565 [Acidobacteriota bacterium]